MSDRVCVFQTWQQGMLMSITLPDSRALLRLALASIALALGLGRAAVASEVTTPVEQLRAGLAKLAGLKKLRAQRAVSGGETVVLVLTGHTLKDADYTINFHRGTLLRDEEAAGNEQQIEALRRNAISVEATPEAVLAVLKGSTS